MLTKLLAITKTAFVETIRQPIYFVLLAAAIGLLMLNPSLAAFSLESHGDNKILQDVAFSTLLLFGLLVSGFSATGVITREIESFTVLTVISKPVPRPVFLLGKYLGVAGAVAVAYCLLSTVFLMTLRHGVMETSAHKFDQPILSFGLLALAISLLAATFGNYVYGWHFTATFTAWMVPLATLALVAALFFSRRWQPQNPLAAEFGPYEDPRRVIQVLYALILILFAVLVLTAFAVALSTRFGQVMTLTLCAAVFLLGLLSDYYFGRHVDDSLLYRIAYAVAPKMQFFWVGDALTQELEIPLKHIRNVAAHAVLYILAVLSFGVALFQTREVG